MHFLVFSLYFFVKIPIPRLFFKKIVDYPLPITLIAQIMVFLITQGAPQITNIVALFAPLDFRGNKTVVLGFPRLYVDETG